MKTWMKMGARAGAAAAGFLLAATLIQAPAGAVAVPGPALRAMAADSITGVDGPVAPIVMDGRGGAVLDGMVIVSGPGYVRLSAPLLLGDKRFPFASRTRLVTIEYSQSRVAGVAAVSGAPTRGPLVPAVAVTLFALTVLMAIRIRAPVRSRPRRRPRSRRTDV